MITACEAKDDWINHEACKALKKRLNHCGYAADGEHSAVQVESIDALHVRDEAEHNTAHSVWNADCREEPVGVAGRYIHICRLIHNVNEGRVEAQAGEKIWYAKKHEYKVHKYGQVNDLVQLLEETVWLFGGLVGGLGGLDWNML